MAILGGGQLGRMTAMAARTMGYRVRVMDPEAACPASFVADETIVGRWDDVAAARRLATGADAVTLEIEQIGVDALERGGADSRRCGPAWSRSASSRTRRCRKPGSRKTDFRSARFAWCAAKRNCSDAVTALGGACFLKIGRGGYDGRGQARIGMDAPAEQADRRGCVDQHRRASLPSPSRRLTSSARSA